MFLIYINYDCTDYLDFVFCFFFKLTKSILQKNNNINEIRKKEMNNVFKYILFRISYKRENIT